MLVFDLNTDMNSYQEFKIRHFLTPHSLKSVGFFFDFKAFL